MLKSWKHQRCWTNTPRLLADRGHGANSLRNRLATTITDAIIPSTRSCSAPIACDTVVCHRRNLIGSGFCRLEDWPVVGKTVHLTVF